MFNIANLLRLLGQQQGMPAMPQGMPTMPQGMQGGSAGMFDQYMRGLFNQRHAPPVMPNTPGSVRPMGGAFGFAPNIANSPVNAQPAPQQPRGPRMYGSWDAATLPWSHQFLAQEQGKRQPIMGR